MAELETQLNPASLTSASLAPGVPSALMEDPPAAQPPTDPVLFESEMNPHLDALYRNALRLTGNPNDAEDLLQDTYLRAYRFFYQYQPGTNAKAWLFRIMNTVFLNDYRRKSRQGETVSYDGLEDFYLYNRLTEGGVGGLGAGNVGRTVVSGNRRHFGDPRRHRSFAPVARAEAVTARPVGLP